MKHKILVPFLIIFFLCLLIAPAFAVETLVYEYGAANAGNDFNYQKYLAAGNDSSAFAQSITGNGHYLSTLSVYLNNTGAPTGTLRGGLWNQTGSLPDGMAPKLANSTNDLAMSSITSSTAEWYNFTFDKTDLLVFGTTYYIGVFVLTGGRVEAANETNLWSDTSSPTAAGSLYSWGGATWSTGSWDLCFRLYTDNYYEGDSGIPLPTEGGYTGTSEQYIDAFISFLMPLILFLLPAILLGAMTKWAKWPILIGLSIGSGLVYMFLGTQYLWLVFLVVIGIIGMAYQAVRSGG